MLTLALIGHGKMCRMIEELAPAHQFEVAFHLSSADNYSGQAITAERFAGVDVAIEFTSPQAAPANLHALAALAIPTVTGTTGWLEALPAISSAFEQSGAALVWSPNFSVGVAVFRKLVEEAGRLLADRDAYGAWAWELHHDAKRDAPSGTLLQLVSALQAGGYQRPVSVSSNRAGRVPGTHEIGFDSAPDTITLRHTARTREGFAAGALQAAQWVVGKHGVHTFDNVLFGH